MNRPRKNPSSAVRLAVYRRDNYTCVRCGVTAAELERLKKEAPRSARAGHFFMTLDHIVPWSLGGSNDPENLQTMCADCNNEKGDLPYV